MNSRRTLTALVALVPQVACLAGPGRLAPPSPAPSQHATTTATRAPSPAASPDAPAPPVATAAPSPTEAPVAASPAPRCTATVRAAVHLRPWGVPDMVGPELPAGTTFEVLGVDPAVQRMTTGRTLETSVLSHVRVAGTDRAGWIFLRESELSACPFHVALPVAQEGQEQQRVWESRYVLRGPRRRPASLVTCCVRPEAADGVRPDPRQFAREDVDGDGVVDEIVHLPSVCRCWPRGDPPGMDGANNGVIALFVHAQDGWHGVEVMPLLDPIHPTGPRSYYEGTFRAGGISYLREAWDDASDAYGCFDGRLPPRVHYDNTNIVLRRLHPDGTLRFVLSMPPFLTTGCVWTGLSDQSIRVTCRRARRSLLLRWDPVAFRLVPEAPGLPYERHNGPLCRREWEDGG